MALLPGCATYSVDKEMEKGSALAKLKDVGLVMRVSLRSKFSLDDHIHNLSSWLGGYKPVKKISVIADGTEKISLFSKESESFYQQKTDDSFLYYKSVGVVNMYLRNNVTELKSLITGNQLDGLVIYEVYNVMSTELQFLDFNSVLIIVDRNLNLLYMDHQADDFDTNEIEGGRIRNELLNMISERLLEELLNLNFIKEE